MTGLRATEVFTPSDYPQHTYVERDDAALESKLRDALDTPGEVVSLSGPSKSGKTVLVERVVGLDNLITVTGAGIESAEDLWNRVLDWMDAPVSTTSSRATTLEASLGAEGGGEGGIHGFAKAKATVKGMLGGSHSKASANTRKRKGLAQVVEEIAKSEFVVLVDDFHYMDRKVQGDVAKQIKEAARLGVKICTASVPHRSDDVVRSNPELRGRVRAIDMSYWDTDALRLIADTGFPLLKLLVPDAAIDRFAVEASGSPQLMQSLCLQACLNKGVREKQSKNTSIDISSTELGEILEETSTRTDFSSLLTKMHRGPKTRGTERKEFLFSDGTKGDVYRCVLLALAADPPRLSFPYKELSQRIHAACIADTPQPQSVYLACEQISRIARDMYPEQRVVDWEDSESPLDIVDPYFLFFLRNAVKLHQLANE